MCLAFGADSLDDVGRRLGDVLEMQPPQGLAEKVRGLKKLKSIADSQPKSVRSGPGAGGRPDRRRGRPRPPAGPDLLAGRRRAVHHAPGGDHDRPAQRRPQRRHVPAAGARPADDGDALADPQGRPRGLPARRRQARGGRRARARSRHRLQRERAAPEARRRVHARRVPARRAGRARAREDRRPRGSRQRGDRARGLHRQGRADRGRARSATTPATTRRPSRSRSSTSPR